jgi:hypothetical protein
MCALCEVSMIITQMQETFQAFDDLCRGPIQDWWVCPERCLDRCDQNSGELSYRQELKLARSVIAIRLEDSEPRNCSNAVRNQVEIWAATDSTLSHRHLFESGSPFGFNCQIQKRFGTSQAKLLLIHRLITGKCRQPSGQPGTLKPKCRFEACYID